MEIEKSIEAIEVLQTKMHIEGPFEIVCDELKAREIAVKALEKYQKLREYLQYLHSFNKYDTLHVYEIIDTLEGIIDWSDE